MNIFKLIILIIKCKWRVLLNMSEFLIFLQIVMMILFIIYLFNSNRNNYSKVNVIDKENRKEMEKLIKLRSVRLTEPLTEKSRPSSFDEIIGQKEGVKALKAAICGPNPQHVIIYGPPGVGKTAAARLVLEYAKSMENSPFKKEAKFVEIDATTLRFDERGIADPLIGSVHDPIYQGAGSLGVINQVSLQPISTAFSFIACANLCNAALLSSVVCSEASFVSPRSFPPIYSASAAAASLWLSSIRENSSSLTV